MTNRCIIIKDKEVNNFICYGESESLIVKKEGLAVYISSIKGSDMYKIANFLAYETTICEEFYLRVCEYIKTGKIFVYYDTEDKHFKTTFDVEEQIKDIKEHLNSLIS